MSLQDKLMIFGFLVIGFFCGGLIYGNAQKADAAKAGPTPPVTFSNNVSLELIGFAEKGKVRIYRLIDLDAPMGGRLCHITVGELHGKTVTMDCTG